MDKKIVGGNNIVKIFLQTDFQKDWAKDKEMTGIFHFFFHLSLESTRPDHCAMHSVARSMPKSDGQKLRKDTEISLFL